MKATKMKITDKIKILLATANSPDSKFEKEGDTGFDAYIEKSNSLDALIEDIRRQAIKEETIIGRVLSFQCMDGNAQYVIVQHPREGQNVVVQWIKYDESYIDGRLGETGVLNIDYVLNQLTWEDSLKQI
jgi:CheY-like chemotaxis protein